MKKFRFYNAVFPVALLLLGVTCLFAARAGRCEYQKANRATGSASSRAATPNEALRAEMKWELGGKPQRGWSLYTALIQRLLDTRDQPASEDFTKALQKWQKKTGLPTNGVLDDVSFYAMVSEWQGRRLKDRTPADPGQLLTAPVSDFYDPTRPDELRRVERETYAAYRRLVAAALDEKSLGLARAGKGELAASEKYLKIISSYRSREYQEKLRRETPNAGRAGLAVNSPHFTGRALDLYVGGEPVETNDPNRRIQVNTRVYQWLVRNAERFGFRPYFYEPWHWEYVG